MAKDLLKLALNFQIQPIIVQILKDVSAYKYFI